MRRKFRGFTLIELLVVIAIIALLISILLPSLSRARELSKRLVCASNVKGIGTSCKIYSNENGEKWPIPAFKERAIDTTGIEYTEDLVGGEGQVGFERERPSLSETAQFTNAGSTRVSVTRAYWMLVRSGDITVQQFVCPSVGEDKDPTEDIDFYYDFSRYQNISYGYQVPFGPRDTRPREGMDNRQAVAADKGPWYKNTPRPDWRGPNNQLIGLEDPPKNWRPFNSRNHGGQDNGEGQNVLFADGHVTFARTPAQGIDNDNIYTVMAPGPWVPQAYNRIHGDTPHETSTPPYPGQGTFGTGPGRHSSTDTLIYP